MADVVKDNGRAHIAGLLSNAVTPPTTYHGNVGSGAGTAVVAAPNTLFTEVATARIPMTVANSGLSRVTTTVTNDTAQYVFTYTASGAGLTVTNAGVGISATSGTADIIQHSDHAGVPLVSGDSIQYTFKIRVA